MTLTWMQFARWLHLAGVVVWVGGMFFAHMALRPALAALDPPQRLALLATALARFLAWVGISVVAILASGAGMLALLGGMDAVNHAIAAMIVAGAVMMLIYVWLIAVPYRLLRSAVAAGDWPRAGAATKRIRHLVAVNLALGFIVLAFGALAR